MTSIREIDLDRDARALVELVREVNPTAVIDENALRHRHETVPARADVRVWVAEVDGRVAGRAHCLRNFFTEGSDSALLDVAVSGDHRRRGIGSALFEIALGHARELEVKQLLTSFHETPAGVAFATRLGFRQVRTETESVLDPRTVAEQPAPGVGLRAVREADPRLVYQVDLEATLDMPQTEPVDHLPYEEWERHVLEHPLFSADGSFVAMVDGVAAAVSLLVADLESGRAHNMFTGTLRGYRGRGLALAVKLASIHWAAEHGVSLMATTNDETNAAMLAVNRRLGYVPAGRRVEWLREGTASWPAPPRPVR